VEANLPNIITAGATFLQFTLTADGQTSRRCNGVHYASRRLEVRDQLAADGLSGFYYPGRHSCGYAVLITASQTQYLAADG
jgi:hypothetical protein